MVADIKKWEKWELWERGVRGYFPPENFVMVDHPREYVDRYSEANEKPDYTFRIRETGEEFYVECKYRSNIIGDMVDVCKVRQIYRYRDQAKQKAFYIFLYLDCSGDRRGYYFFPLSVVKNCKLFYSRIKNYRVDLGSFDFFTARRAGEIPE